MVYVSGSLMIVNTHPVVRDIDKMQCLAPSQAYEIKYKYRYNQRSTNKTLPSAVSLYLAV